MFDFFWKVLTSTKSKPQQEWYCTYCGRNDFYHTEDGKLHTHSNEPCVHKQSACPLDLRDI